MIGLKTSYANRFVGILLPIALVGCGGSDDDKAASPELPTDGGVVSKALISTLVTEGGVISPTSQTVNYGQTATFTLIPDFGYQIDSVSGCEGTPEANQYTTGAITTACAVTASFKPLAVPQNVIVQAGDQALTIDWTLVDGAQSYQLYYDVAGDIDPLHYASRSTAEMVSEVTPPHVLTGLDNGITYYLVVTAMHKGQESLASNELSAAPQAVVQATNPLNDTGIDTCANSSQNNLECPVQGYEGQDGEHGRDALARKGQLQKIGGGPAGFDFTKLDNSGYSLPESASEWSCVRDNHTGLIWEVKQPAGSGGLRDANHTYSWYNSDNSSNGGIAGTQNGGSCQGSACDTTAFVNAVNAEGLCGASDWRMPSVHELLSIVHNNGRREEPGQDYFPHTGVYWSSLSHYGGYGAWHVSGGYVEGYYKYFDFEVRLVRVNSEPF